MTTQLVNGEVFSDEPHEKVVFKELGECSHTHPEVCQACDFYKIYRDYPECPWPKSKSKTLS